MSLNNFFLVDELVHRNELLFSINHSLRAVFVAWWACRIFFILFYLRLDLRSLRYRLFLSRSGVGVSIGSLVSLIDDCRWLKAISVNRLWEGGLPLNRSFVIPNWKWSFLLKDLIDFFAKIFMLVGRNIFSNFPFDHWN